MTALFPRIGSARQGGFSRIILPALPPDQSEFTELVIYYPSIAPSLGKLTPDGVDARGVFRAAGVIYENEVVSQFYNIESDGTSNVLRFDENGNISWEFEVPGFRVGTGDFTLEFYSRVENIRGGAPEGYSGSLSATLLDDSVPDFGSLGVGGTYVTLEQGRVLPAESSTELYSASVEEVNESNEQVRKYETNLAGSAVSSESYSHVSLQRIDGTLYGHFRGQPMSLTVGSSSSPVANYGTSRLRIFVGFANSGDGALGDCSIYSGQIRISTRGVYGAGEYTPPTQPFYIP
jgi:hypothetical protein